MYLCLSEQNISKLENLPNDLEDLIIENNNISKLENLPNKLTILYINNNKFIYKCNVKNILLQKYTLKLYKYCNYFQIRINKNQLIYF